MKKFPLETVNSETGDIKGGARYKEHKESGYLKISPDNASRESKGTITQKGKGNDAMMTEKQHYTIKLTNANIEPKGTITQKGKGNDAMMTEKQHYTIKLSNANKQAEAAGQSGNAESAATTQKKHVANIKWTPGKAAKDTTSQESKALNPYLKINGVKK